jgi:hypothetical protein
MEYGESMNEQLQAALAEILGKASNAAQGGVAFLQGELPEVIRQLLMWKAIHSLIHLALTIAVIFGAIALFKRGAQVAAAMREQDAKPTNSIHYHSDSGGFWISLWLGVGTLLGGALLTAMLLNSFNWLKILIAPKIFLIDYAAPLAKGAT